MIITLAAALSLAASMAIDVPYLPQTDALCGGAATAMVFRYWGDAHADVQEFAPLVDRRAGGIATDALTAAVTSRGWRTSRVDGSLEALGARVHDGQPVVVLLPDRADRYHYVVVIGVSDAAVVVHDPAWGPSRTIRAADFERSWNAAGFWSLVILPPVASTGTATHWPDPETPVLASAAEPADACDVRLNRALDEIRAQGLDRADALLGEVRSECPAAPGPIRELSGVRFAQRRWNDAAALAREVLRHNPADEYALDVLGSALFMQNDDIGALQAWNRIGKPRVNRVRIDGLHHTRYQMVAELMGIQPNMLLTAEMYGRARRRLGELPRSRDDATGGQAGGRRLRHRRRRRCRDCRGAAWGNRVGRRLGARDRQPRAGRLGAGLERAGRSLVRWLALDAQSSWRLRRLCRTASQGLAGCVATRRRLDVGFLRRRAGFPRGRDAVAWRADHERLVDVPRAVLGDGRAGRMERRSQSRIDWRRAGAGRL